MLRGLLILSVAACLYCVDSRSLKPDLGDWRVLSSAGDIWKDCSEPGAHGKILNATISPDPPVIGEEVTVSASVQSDEEITAGKVEIKVTYEGIFPYTFNYDLCDLSKKINYPCPLQKGTISVSVPAKIPKEAPKGSYTGRVLATDQNGQQLACINLSLTL